MRLQVFLIAVLVSLIAWTATVKVGVATYQATMREWHMASLG